MLKCTKILFFVLVIIVSLVSTADAQIPLVVNEFMAANSETEPDPQGEYDDWIEIYNYGVGSVDMSGMYLTDDLSFPTKWRFPDELTLYAGDYLLIWADGDTTDTGLHANFKLSADGEEIGLFEADGVTLIDSITFGEQTGDVSYGRFPDATDNWYLFATPTPSEENTDAYVGQVKAPEFSQSRGFYDEPFTVTIATETEGAEIYYAINGDDLYEISPRDGSVIGTPYSGPITIDRTTCLRAQAIKPGWKDSEIVTQTYIFLDDVIRQPAYPEGFPSSWGSRIADYEMDRRVVDDPAYSGEIKDDLMSTPSVCIGIANSDFFGSGGIYANPTRYGDEWERSATIEWIDPNTGEQFGVNAGLRIHGGPYSRSGNPKNALRVIFRSEYGPSRLEFPLFPDTNVSTFKVLALRSIWNYSWTGHSGMSGSRHADYLRDVFARDTVRDMERLTPYGRPIQVYINGLYWGLYIMTERPDERFVADHLGGDEENYDMLEAPSGSGVESVMSIVSGGEQARQAWEDLFAMAGSTDLSTSQAYEAMQEQFDIPSMIDYMLMIYYVGSRDAPVFLGDSYHPRNFYVARQREPVGPFKFIPWDTEWALEYPDENRVYVVGVYNPHYLIDRLRVNSEFIMLMADRIHKQFFNDGALTREKTTQRYMDRANEIYGAIVGESARWGDEPRPNRPYTRDNEWLGEVNRLVNEYFSGRTERVLEQLTREGFYPRVSAPEFSVNGSYQHGGRITPDDALTMSAVEGTIYYTLDGSDPRFDGNELKPIDYTTLIAENANKRVLVPTGPVGNNWRESISYDDSTWLSCTGSPGGVGYERTSGYEDLISLNVHDQMYGRNATCYVRIPFDVNADTIEFGHLTLKARYDDGFIAYLNGAEIARRNFNGTPMWNSNAGNSNSDFAAVVFEDIDISDSLSLLHEGSNLLAIHALNATTNSSDFLISVELVTGKNAEAITLSHSAVVKARVLEDDTWSALNEAVFAVGPVAENLRITEIMYHPQMEPEDINDPNEEFIELTNIGAEPINLNLVSFTNGIDFTFPDMELAPGDFVVVVENIDAFESRYGTSIPIAGEYSGKLNNNGERIRLEDAIGRTILDFSYSDNWRSITDEEGFSLTIIDPANPDLNSWDEKDSWRASADAGGSPGFDDSGIVPNPGAVVINELLANSLGDAPDWIELYNTTNSSINIGGWFLSDRSNDPKKYKIAAGTTIGPNGYIIFYQDLHFGNAGDPGSIETFALSNNGESVILSSAEGDTLTGYRTVEDFGASQTSVSFGRYYKSSTDNYNFVAMESETPGSANAYPKVGPVVINEIMYNPDWPDGGSYTNEQYEYIELYNISTEPVNLQGWKFTNGIDFTFPEDMTVIIPAGGYILVVREPDAFAWRYIDVPIEKIFGPYEGQLSNAGESLELGMPNGNRNGSGEPYYIRIDRVNYSDGSHPENCPGGIDLWPPEADGEGLSLHRITPDNYSNDPDNWLALTPKPGE
jgi:hypothetical protein